MNVKTYTIVSSAIFAVVAVLHLLRIIGQWAVTVNGWDVPMWASFLGVIVAGLLTFTGFRALQQIQHFLS